MAAVLFWLVRSLQACRQRYFETKPLLSALSIKNAVDSLHTGIMFCEEDGFIMLVNMQMQRIMMDVAGRVFRNGKRFYDLLTEGKTQPNSRIIWFEGQNVCMMPDGSTWTFTISQLHIKKKKYIQLTASDVTERWKLTAELQQKSIELIERQKELGETIANLHILTREIEVQRAKMRAHDILGQRLTLMLRTAQSEQPLDTAFLRSMSQVLIDDLETIRTIPSPQDEVESIKQTFGSVGVEVLVGGELPKDGEKGQLIAGIVREAVSNAIKHGFATQVFVSIEEIAGACRILIADNGRPQTGHIVEGGGLSGIRQNVEAIGGQVTVSVTPRFLLAIDLPE